MNKLIHVIKSNDYEPMKDDLKFNYLGLFKDNNFKSFREFSNKELVSKGVYVIYDCVFTNKKDYKYSQQFIDEIYAFLKLHVEIALADTQNEIDNCFFKMDAFLDKEAKINFLKEKYKEIYPVNNPVPFAIYQERKDCINTNGIEKWSEWMLYSFEFNQLVFLFLTFQYNKIEGEYVFDQFGWFMNFVYQNKNSIDEDFFEFLNDWKECYEKDLTLNLIIKKINELESNYNHVQGGSKTLIDILDDPGKYDMILKNIVSHGIAEKSGKKYKIITPEKLRPQTFICSIAYQLQRKNYLKIKTTNVEMAEAMTDLFNTTVTKKNFNYLIKECSRMNEYLKPTEHCF